MFLPPSYQHSPSLSPPFQSHCSWTWRWRTCWKQVPDCGCRWQAFGRMPGTRSNKSNWLRNQCYISSTPSSSEISLSSSSKVKYYGPYFNDLKRKCQNHRLVKTQSASNFVGGSRRCCYLTGGNASCAWRKSKRGWFEIASLFIGVVWA